MYGLFSGSCTRDALCTLVALAQLRLQRIWNRIDLLVHQSGTLEVASVSQLSRQARENVRRVSSVASTQSLM